MENDLPGHLSTVRRKKTKKHVEYESSLSFAGIEKRCISETAQLACSLESMQGLKGTAYNVWILIKVIY